MVFPAHTEINFICLSPIRVELSHNQYITLAVSLAAAFTVSHRTWNSPTAPLDATFARDWQKLLCELRVKDLKDNQMIDRPIGRRIDPRDLRDFSHSKTVYAHLAMGPSITDSVPDIFYPSNVFEIDFNTFGILRPPTWANAHIRYLSVSLQLTAENWDALATFAATTATVFPKLCHFIVTLEWRTAIYVENFIKRVPSHGVDFHCSGEVIFGEPRFTHYHRYRLGRLGLFQEEAERRIIKAVTFKQ